MVSTRSRISFFVLWLEMAIQEEISKASGTYRMTNFEVVHTPTIVRDLRTLQKQEQ